MNNLLDNFGTNCFSEKNLKNRVPDYVVKKFLEIKNGKAELTLEIADIIANAIKAVGIYNVLQPSSPFKNIGELISQAV